FAQRGGDAFAAFDVGGGDLDGLLHDDVADGLGDDLQHFEDGHAAADERGERAGEAREADLVRDLTEDGELDAPRVPEFASRFGLDEVNPAVNPAARAEQ